MRARRIWIATAALALGWCGLVRLGLEYDARAGTQQCNTACQEKMTDCILACDGVLSCELACKAAAVGCVQSCTRAAERAADAGVRARAEDISDAGAEAASDAEAGQRSPNRDAEPKETGRKGAPPRDR
jgi:hypothetical protein